MYYKPISRIISVQSIYIRYTTSNHATTKSYAWGFETSMKGGILFNLQNQYKPSNQKENCKKYFKYNASHQRWQASSRHVSDMDFGDNFDNQPFTHNLEIFESKVSTTKITTKQQLFDI